MPRRRFLRLSLVPLTALTMAVALGPAGPSRATPNAGGSATACDKRVNDSADTLLPCIRKDELWKYMQDFQAIADANPGADGHASRNSGEPGYKASADYVANIMRNAGYNVSIQTYTFDYFAYQGVPQMSEVSPTARDYQLVSEWNPGRSQGSTTATAVQPVGGTLIPPTGGSTSGCDPSDFTGFTAGNIALIQRGTCTFSNKIANAQAAGAAGVVIFNEGNTPARSGVFNGSLSDVPSIPVAFTSFDIGDDLYNQYQAAVANSTALPTMTLSVQGIHDPAREDYNVIADSKTGDPNHTVVIDAHLDAIYGAGMLDNASGSTTILDIGRLMKKVHPTNRLRFIWFGGEELGLFGSKNYVNNLSADELSRIGYDLDADVTATPNYSIGVLDPAAVDLFGRTVSTQFPANVYEPSKVARDEAVNYFSSIGLNHIFFSPVGTDAFEFNLAGVPASGLLTGQDCCKTQEEVDLFGGYTGNYEGNVPSTDGGCVDNPFRWCDNLSNNDPNVLTFMTKAFAKMVLRMAFDTTTMYGQQAAATRTATARASTRPEAHEAGPAK
jgi:Peptidase family M28/PA domain